MTTMSQRDFSENEPESTSELPAANRALFLEKVRQSNAACQSGDFATAVSLYTDALQLDPGNYILYSNRSAARLKQGQFTLSLQDAIKAKELCPQWPKAYFRQGVALQCLGRYGEALAAFSSGLAQDANNKQLLSGLIEASIKSPLRHALESTFQQLQNMKLDQSSFVVISVVGQELLQAGQYQSAVTVLEAALRIGSCSLKLRGSVFSALSSAYWALNQLDKAISSMQQDLATCKSLGDTAGECRAHGNLGSAYFSQGSYKEALTAHRYQLVLAMKYKDVQASSQALTSLGHVYTAIGDYTNALASHKQCVQLVKQMGDRLQEAREIGNVGAVYLAMGEFDSAVDCHTQHLRIARKLGNQVEEARAYSNLGSVAHYRRNFSQAINCHEQVLRIAQQLGDRNIEARAYAGLGHAARCAGDLVQAKRWHEKQLEMALAVRDKFAEGRACSNLGIVYQLLGENDAALKLHQAHLSISKQLQDRAGMGRAFGNIGNAYSAAGLYEAAIKYHKSELTISKEVRDRSSEASTHGNLAVAYQALGAHDMALVHYRAHLSIARELKDTAGEACALLNLGNCLSSRQEFSQAIIYYEQYLMLSQELGDVAAESKACHFLGYAHYCIGNYREAIRYYDQDLALAKDLQDKMNVGRAYCNLGLAHLALGSIQIALECQKYFLTIAHITNHLPGKFRALGNIGDILIKTGEIDEAAKMYHRQLALARQSRERAMEAAACGALGLTHKLMKKFDKSLGYHTQEYNLRREIGDISGECKAHGHLGAIHMSLGNYSHAIKSYQQQLERAQEIHDSTLEAQAYGSLGIAKLNMGLFEEAIGFLEQQLATLEQQTDTSTILQDRARALGHLGDCYDALGDYEESVKCHERHLHLATQLQSFRDQEKAYRGLGLAHQALGNLKEALVCLEKRLVVAHELGNSAFSDLGKKAAAYGDLGNIHNALGNYEQAINCLEHQKEIAKELGDEILLSDASSSLGNVYQNMGKSDDALKLHIQDLEKCESLEFVSLQARASGNLGKVYESLKNYTEAIKYFEKQLSLASDRLSKAFACGALGRVYLQIGETAQAINFLRQGLAIAQSLNKSEEEAKIRHQLGLALRTSGENENAKIQLETAAQILESVRFEQRSSETRTILFDLQTSCFHVLQQILVEMQRSEEALLVAERCKARTSTDSNNITISRKNMTISNDSIYETVNKAKTNVIYFSIAGEELYAWFIQPQKKIIRFHSTKINETTLKISSDMLLNGKLNENESLLERYVNMVRDSLGVNSDSVLHEGDGSGWRSSSENLLDDFATERSGFLRMVNRNHLMNSSNYSLSSLFSLGSVGGSVTSLQGSTRSIGSIQGSGRMLPQWQGPSCLHTLYSLLLEPFDDLLPTSDTVSKIGRKELILVLENELYLVPFAVLRSGQQNGEYLSERCSILTVPSLQSLRLKSKIIRNRDQAILQTALVVGGPRIPSTLSETWGWSDSPAAIQEASMVADMLQCKPLVACNATKEAVMTELPVAECVHFAANLSWKLGAVVLSPGDVVDSQKGIYPNGNERGNNEDDSNDITNDIEVPPLPEFTLTSADVLTMKLNAKLVVLSSYHSIEPINGNGVANLAGSWLCAGAGAVLISLWPVPETAAKILLRAFYSALLQGTRAARALAEAMQTVQHTKHFAHPANWAGFLLIGANIRLSNKVALMGQALCELMKNPEKCRDALRVCLHLVEKSLQRINRGQRNAMYTTQKSIENKAGSVNGWKDLLMAVGFRFEPAANGIPSSVFFPQSDPEDRLSQCSASLQALLALSPSTLYALSKLVDSSEIADDIIAVIRNVLSMFPPKGSPEKEVNLEVPLSVHLWRTSGCHELLASLGFDLMEVGQSQVTLRTGKQASRRNCQFVLQALLALFDTQEAPKSLGLDSCSSSESLNDESRSEIAQSSTSQMSSQQQRSISPAGTVKSMNSQTIFPPTIPNNRPQILSGTGAFTSYVRRRGEPDGGQNDTDPIQNQLTKISNQSVTNNLYPTLDSNQLTTDSELSDGYTPYTLGKNKAPRLGYSSLRNPVRVSRPGGGGESDAAFTPSPPVTTTQNHSDPNVQLALAHQTRIRNLYSGNTFLSDTIIPEMTITSNNISRRPDSSSSTSSATDWEGSGHATVLRRSNPNQTYRQPLVDSLRNLSTLNSAFHAVKNHLQSTTTNKNILPTLESTSSESEFERGLELNTINSTNIFGFRGKSKIKMGQNLNMQNRMTQKIQFMERQLNSRNILNNTNDLMIDKNSTTTTTTTALNECETSLIFNTSNLCLTNNNSDNDLLDKDINLINNNNNNNNGNNHLQKIKSHNILPIPISTSTPNTSSTSSSSLSHVSTGTTTTGLTTNKDINNKTNIKIQDSIIRHMNREMTPTISDVYHERNIGLGLAPSLSKLLLTKNYDETELKLVSNTINDSNHTNDLITTATTSTSTTNNNNNNNNNCINVTNITNCITKIDTTTICSICNEPNDIICRCKTATIQKKSISKPWLTNVPSRIVKSSDLATSEIVVERQNKSKQNKNLNSKDNIGLPSQTITTTSSSTVNSNSNGTQHQGTTQSSVLTKRSTSPFSDLSKRDEGDGRSVADSQCSSTYKTDINVNNVSVTLTKFQTTTTT